MAAAGVDWFVSQKLSWNETNRFPHHTFWWEGIDGTRVRAHFPPADTYNGVMSLRQLFRSARAARSIYPFGHGDGGGGPTREMLEAARRANDLDGVPTVALEPPAAFFAAVEADPAPLPVWVGDLYLEKHRGTFTSQAGIKRGNRRGEAALQAAELWTAAVSTWPGRARHRRRPISDELEAAWRLLLTNQFHDILPGSSIRWVAEEAEAELAEVERRAGAVAGRRPRRRSPPRSTPPGWPSRRSSSTRRPSAAARSWTCRPLPPCRRPAVGLDHRLAGPPGRADSRRS